MLWMTTTIVSIVCAGSRAHGHTLRSARTGPANRPTRVLGGCCVGIANRLLGVRQRLAVRTDLHLGALGTGENVRFVGDEHALLGQRLDFADLTRTRRMLQAFP